MTAVTATFPVYGPRPSGGTHATRPYVGLASFRDTPEDRALFFGRSAERGELLNLVLSESLVVLFGRSGLGKSSLINAALLEDLRAERYFPVAARINDVARGPSGSLLQCVDLAARRDGLTVIGERSDDLWSYFQQVQFHSGERAVRPVLIIDQFEELFTAYEPAAEGRKLFVQRLADLVRRRVPDVVRSRAVTRLAELTPERIAEAVPEHDTDRAAQRAALLAERASLLRVVYEDVSPDVKIVLVIREDFVPELHSLRGSIPFILRNSIRLEAFTLEQARQAIEGPTRADVVYERGRMAFADGVVDLMIEQLRVHDVGGRSFKGDRVEPLQLAILCRFLYERRRGSAPMTASQIRRSGGLRQAVKNYYLGVVRRLPHLRIGPNGRGWRPSLDNFLLVNRPRAAFRRLCERGLIDASGFRANLNAPVVRKRFGLGDRDLRIVLEQRLLNAEPRPGTTSYELAHDSLVRPLLQLRLLRRFTRIGYTIIALLLLLIWAGTSSTREDRVTVADDSATVADRQAALRRLVANREELRGVGLPGLDLTRGYYPGARLDSANLSAATLDSATLDSAALRGARLTGSSLRSASLTGALLQGADLGNVGAAGVNLHGADLRGAKLSHASLVQARLAKARLDSADLRAADLRGADMDSSSIAGADFTETPWWLAHGWSGPQIVALGRDFALAGFVRGATYRHAIDSLSAGVDSARVAIARGDPAAIAEARLSTALHRRARYVALTGTDLDAAYSDVQQALRQLRDSSAPALLDTRGFILLRRTWGGDPTRLDRRRGDALKDLQRALKLDAGADTATLSERYYHLGLAYQALNDPDPAVASFRRATALGYRPTYERLLTPPNAAHPVAPQASGATALVAAAQIDAARLGVRKRAPEEPGEAESVSRAGQTGPRAENGIDALYPETAAKVRKLLAEAEHRGMKPKVVETYRSPERQAFNNAIGSRLEAPNAAPTSVPKYSTHWCRVAIDIVDAERRPAASPDWYRQLGEIGTSVGLKWFGDPRYGSDYSHFEDPQSVRAPCRVVNGDVTPPSED
jgi:tetratricopeptide (TPR) repeat protein